VYIRRTLAGVGKDNIKPTRASIGHGRNTRGLAQRTTGQSAGRATFQTFGTVALEVDDGATFARNGLEDFNLFAILADNEMPYEDGAVHAGTGAQALKAAELRLYGVVVILGRWVRGMSIRKLAEEGSVSTETIYSLEHGRRDFIWPKTARKLANALGVDPDDLYR
jgi:DNA-binding XRE family transcriptional regulator